MERATGSTCSSRLMPLEPTKQLAAGKQAPVLELLVRDPKLRDARNAASA
jgi:hypothetical protein